MSQPTTPSPKKAAVAVSPGDAVAEDRAVVIVDGFESGVVDRIVTLLAPTSTDVSAILSAGILTLFTKVWHTLTWEDLLVFTSDDVVAAMGSRDDIPAELKSPVLVKKLGYIIDYAQYGNLADDMTMIDIVKRVKSASGASSAPLTNPNSPSRRSVQVFDKKAVPTLDKFSGHDEDYFAWKESTINVLGTAGFGRFLSEKTMVTKNPEVSESVFYALRGAVHGGQAQSIAQGMLDDTTLDPAALWARLEEYYDTALNRANVVLFDIRRLLNIRLTPDSTATKFISDYRDCLQRLRKNNARLSEDMDTLRALLLVSIQDDDFDTVRDSIVHKPNSSVETILTEIRERETSLMMKDQASNVGGDGSTSARYSRRTPQASSLKQTSKYSSGDRQTSGDKKWNIPRLPDSWKKSFGGPLFKLILEWRVDAHKGKTQQQLNTLYDTVVEKFRPSQKGSATSRRASQSGSHTDPGTSASSGSSLTGKTEASTMSEADQPQRKRIRLQKSRRVVTESSA